MLPLFVQLSEHAVSHLGSAHCLTDCTQGPRVHDRRVPASSAGHSKLSLPQVKQKGGTVEQVVIADMAFDVLKVAWGKFEATELRK